jgi:predicted transcriptional regulator
MAMTLRLSAQGEERLEQITQRTGLSKTAAVELALEDFDERAEHRARVHAAFEKVRTRDAELLRLLAE